MLKAENLIKTFEKNEKHGKKISFNAVDNISFEANEGEIVGVLGPNGAGKTTLLRMLGSLMKPTSGQVSIWSEGQLIEGEKNIKKKIGYLSGNTKLYGRLTTRELLGILGNIYGISEKNIKERTEEICEILNMSDFIDNRIEKLSTGQTQRASISRCLIHKPDIYIFDEPTLGLDIMSSSAIVEFMKEEQKKGRTVIYSTHYMEEAEFLCDRIILINEGRVVRQGSLDEMRRSEGLESLRDIFTTLIKREDIKYEF